MTDDAEVRTLVIGYGSDLRRDDAAGRLVAEAVEALGLPGVDVDVRVQLVPEVAELLVAVDRVVFVDASVDVSEVTVVPVTAASGSVADSHHATPSRLLAFAELVGERPPEAFLVEVPAFDLSLGEGLSDECAAGVARAIRQVTELLSQ